MLVMPSASFSCRISRSTTPIEIGIEPDEGLVVDEHLGVHHDRARERHAPRHAAGELRRHQPRGAAQAHGVQLRQHERADQPLRQVRVLAQREGDVLEDVEIREQRAVLEQHAHAPAQRVELAARRSVRDVPPVDTRRCRGRAGSGR